MKKLLLLHVFLIMPCYSMESLTDKNINSLIAQLNAKHVSYCTSSSASNISDKNHIQVLSTIINKSSLDPFLKNDIKELFDTIDPFYESVHSTESRKEIRKKTIDAFKTYLHAMVQYKLLSNNLQSISSTPKELICNDEYRYFLSAIKNRCWDVYKKNFKQHAIFFAVGGLNLALLNSKLVTTWFEDEAKKTGSNPQGLFNVVTITVFGIGNGLDLLIRSGSYFDCSRGIARLERLTYY